MTATPQTIAAQRFSVTRHHTQQSKTHPRVIRFVDSHSRELFKIPDGANIKIIYPPGDGRWKAQSTGHAEGRRGIMINPQFNGKATDALLMERRVFLLEFLYTKEAGMGNG